MGTTVLGRLVAMSTLSHNITEPQGVYMRSPHYLSAYIHTSLLPSTLSLSR